MKGCGEQALPAVLGPLGHVGLDGPVLGGDECVYLRLPVHNQTQGHGLNATGGQSSTHLAPQDGAEPVSNDPVQHAPRLLGVNEVAVQVTGVGERFGDGFTGNLVEHDALGLALGNLDGLHQMP